MKNLSIRGVAPPALAGGCDTTTSKKKITHNTCAGEDIAAACHTSP